jgi:cathepsin L
LRTVAGSEEDALFQTIKRQYGKAYFDQHDEEFRKNIFVQNLQKIRAHNDAGEHTYTLAMNEFGDMTFEEFHAKHTGFKGVRHQYLRSRNIADLSHVQVTDSIDWSAKGAVTPIKNQGQCGSCWAFSTTGAIEGAWFVAKGQLVNLSEQQLMDCSKSEGNDSCEGGLMDYAFEFVISNKGICSEASYPYKEADENTCQTCTPVATISKYSDVSQSEDALKAAVTQQPVSVAIEADQEAFQFYSSGVLTGTCGQQLDHGVLAVGFGTLSGTDYWKVKNSWGTSWGMSGYVLIERGTDECGIHNAASFPTV